MNFIKALFIAIAILFLASSASAYYPYGGSYGALEYPNSYYNYTYLEQGRDFYGSYSRFYNFTPYSTYYYDYSSWHPRAYNTYYRPVYLAYSDYPTDTYIGYDKVFRWNGFGFSFDYVRNYT